MKYLIYTAELGSINKAAQKLFLPQSTLSNVIKNIEEEFQYPLFKRTNKGIFLTDKGEKFISSAKIIYSEYEKMHTISKVSTVNDSLSISIFPSSFFSHCYFSFVRSNPCTNGCDTLIESVFTECMSDLIHYKSRIAVFYMTSNQRQRFNTIAEKYNIEMVLLKDKVKIMIMMSAFHELASCNEIDISELAKYKLVTYKNIDNRDFLDVCCIENQSNILYVNSRASFNDAISSGEYIAPSINIHPSMNSALNCVCKPLKNYHDMSEIYLLSLKNYNLNKREELFVEYLKMQLEDYYD
ncbi:LysR family transcriptional regulator [Clostridium sp. BL8]|uniref:LysR family transcriptional regulator n=1 Tax=Clostridium sp. BL8 TaxID=1354301 RepID=UPI001377E75A|nr:LysR family transcriptional regulator [Clostridium sp. BL8]